MPQNKVSKVSTIEKYHFVVKVSKRTLMRRGELSIYAYDCGNA